MRIYTGLPVLLFILAWNFTSYAQTPCINYCNPAYETKVISPYNASATIPWHSAYATYDPTNFDFTKYYRLVMSHESGSYLLSNIQMRFDGVLIYSNVGFQFTGGGLNLTGDLAGNALPGAYEVLNFDIYERFAGIYYKKSEFKFTLTVTCGNNLVVSSPVTKTTPSVGKYESNGYLKVYGAQANTGTGQLNFDGQNYVEFLPEGSGFQPASLTVSNGSMEAYIEGCGGAKSGTINEIREESLTETNLNMSLSPNPNTGRAIVSLGDSESEKYLWLYDASGRLLQEKVTDQREFELDVSDQPSGVYFLHVNVNGQQQVLKMLKE